MLRDHGRDPQIKKEALQMLDYALGRSSTHYFFLPQRPQNPIDLRGQTGSGLMVGKIKGTSQSPYFDSREELLPGDILRLGYEDEKGHAIQRIQRAVPKGGRMHVRLSSKKGFKNGLPVFLTDRRDTHLDRGINELQEQLGPAPSPLSRLSNFEPVLPFATSRKSKIQEITVFRHSPKIPEGGQIGVWLSGQALKKVSGKNASRIWWWLPPVIWPDTEQATRNDVQAAVRKGARSFVLNAPWQVSFFKSPQGLSLWAGPFCNLANPLALAIVESMGCCGAIVSPELGGKDFLQLPQQSPIPLGIVVAGNWPLCVARSAAREILLDQPFASPMGEQSWVTRYGTDFWTYPNWQLDLGRQKNALQKAGYVLFVNLVEPVPKRVKLKKRKGLWNWDISLK
jgi:putative protease